MGVQGLCTKHSLLAPADRPEFPTLHPGVANDGRSPLPCSVSAGLPRIHLVPPRPAKSGVWPCCRVGGGLLRC